MPLDISVLAVLLEQFFSAHLFLKIFFLQQSGQFKFYSLSNDLCSLEYWLLEKPLGNSSDSLPTLKKIVIKRCFIVANFTKIFIFLSYKYSASYLTTICFVALIDKFVYVTFRTNLRNFDKSNTSKSLFNFLYEVIQWLQQQITLNICGCFSWRKKLLSQWHS